MTPLDAPPAGWPASGALFGQIAVSDEAARATSDEAFVEAMLSFEVALAAAECELGIVPAEASEAIAAAAAVPPDPVAIGRAARSSGNPVVPLVQALRAAVPIEVSAFVHLGATSQDALDTAAMLVASKTCGLVLEELNGASAAVARLARAHVATPMAGRTLLQQAVPVTFGLKAAGWLSGVLETARRLAEVRRTRLAVQLGGAAGTLAALGGDGPAVVAALAARLGLAEPLLPWHGERTRVAELAASLGAVAGALGKVALDVALMSQTEVAEVSEQAGEGAMSSAMPHKRNPAGSTAVLAAVRRAHGLVPVLSAAMAGEHERSAGAWQSEWEALAELLRTVSGAAWRARRVLEGLVVDERRLAANLAASNGLVLSERYALALAPALGRPEAGALVGAAAASSALSGRSLGAELAAIPKAASALGPAELAALADPRGYLGSSSLFVERVLADYENARKELGWD